MMCNRMRNSTSVRLAEGRVQAEKQVEAVVLELVFKLPVAGVADAAVCTYESGINQELFAGQFIGLGQLGAADRD